MEERGAAPDGEDDHDEAAAVVGEGPVQAQVGVTGLPRVGLDVPAGAEEAAGAAAAPTEEAGADEVAVVPLP